MLRFPRANSLEAHLRQRRPWPSTANSAPSPGIGAPTGCSPDDWQTQTALQGSPCAGSQNRPSCPPAACRSGNAPGSAWPGLQLCRVLSSDGRGSGENKWWGENYSRATGCEVVWNVIRLLAPWGNGARRRMTFQTRCEGVCLLLLPISLFTQCPVEMILRVSVAVVRILYSDRFPMSSSSIIFTVTLIIFSYLLLC